LEQLRKDYMRIISIFSDISQTSTEDKQKKIETYRPEMTGIEESVLKTDKHLTSRVGGLKENLKKTISF
jgi:hypothetical protein